MITSGPQYSIYIIYRILLTLGIRDIKIDFDYVPGGFEGHIKALRNSKGTELSSYMNAYSSTIFMRDLEAAIILKDINQIREILVKANMLGSKIIDDPLWFYKISTAFREYPDKYIELFQERLAAIKDVYDLNNILKIFDVTGHKKILFLLKDVMGTMKCVNHPTYVAHLIIEFSKNQSDAEFQHIWEKFINVNITSSSELELNMRYLSLELCWKLLNALNLNMVIKTSQDLEMVLKFLRDKKPYWERRDYALLQHSDYRLCLINVDLSEAILQTSKTTFHATQQNLKLKGYSKDLIREEEKKHKENINLIELVITNLKYYCRPRAFLERAFYPRYHVDAATHIMSFLKDHPQLTPLQLRNFLMLQFEIAFQPAENKKEFNPNELFGEILLFGIDQCDERLTQKLNPSLSVKR